MALVRAQWTERTVERPGSRGHLGRGRHEASEDEGRDSKWEPSASCLGLWLLGMREAGDPEDSWKRRERRETGAAMRPHDAESWRLAVVLG